VSSGGGRGGEGGLGGWSEQLVRAVALGGQGDGKHEEENLKGKLSALSSRRL
jgi:hypothetical protein